MKLNKEQRKILTNAVESFEKHGVKKPIHVASPDKMKIINEFGPSYARYCKSMDKLVQAGLIAHDHATTCYAYIVDHDEVRKVLEA